MLNAVAYISVLLGSVAACAQFQSEPATRSPLGIYVLTGIRQAKMELRQEGGRHVATLSGGAAPAAGNASAADCYIRAIGDIHGRKLVATFAKTETDTFSYSSSRAEVERRMLKIEFTNDEATVTRADVQGYCGLDTDFLGQYRRGR